MSEASALSFMAVCMVMTFHLLALSQCAPVPENEYDLVQDCFYSASGWSRKSSHQCYHITQQTGVANMTNFSSDRLAQLRSLSKDYLAGVKHEYAALRDCYYAQANHDTGYCVKKVQNRKKASWKYIGQYTNYLLKLWDHIVEEDKQLAADCFKYHQWHLYKPCHGITWDHDTPLVSYRRKSIIRKEWLRLENERDNQIRKFMSNFQFDHAQVNYCLYNTKWRKQNATDHILNEFDLTWTNASSLDICYVVTFPFPLPKLYPNFDENLFKLYREHVLKLRIMYLLQLVDDTRYDCCANHEYEREMQCYGYTWTVQHETGDIVLLNSKQCQEMKQKKRIAKEAEMNKYDLMTREVLFK